MALVKAVGTDTYPSANGLDDVYTACGLSGTQENVVYESAFNTGTILGTQAYLRVNTNNGIELPFTRATILNPAGGSTRDYEYTVTAFIPVGATLTNGDGVTEICGIGNDGLWRVAVQYANSQIQVLNHLGQINVTTEVLEAGKPYTFTIRTKGEIEGLGEDNGRIEVWMNNTLIYTDGTVDWPDEEQNGSANMQCRFGGPGFDMLFRDIALWDLWSSGVANPAVFHRVVTLDTSAVTAAITGTVENDLGATASTVNADDLQDFDDVTLVNMIGAGSAYQVNLGPPETGETGIASAFQVYARARKNNSELTSLAINTIDNTNDSVRDTSTVTLTSDTIEADIIRQFTDLVDLSEIAIRYDAVAG